MKALSLTQPWATLVAIGAKRIETRSWSTDYRGEIAIHAAKGFPRDCREVCWRDPFREWLYDRDLPLGAIVAVARLTDVTATASTAMLMTLTPRERAFGDYAAGRYGWLLADVRALRTPIPCKGALGIWTVPADVEAAVREQLA